MALGMWCTSNAVWLTPILIGSGALQQSHTAGWHGRFQCPTSQPELCAEAPVKFILFVILAVVSPSFGSIIVWLPFPTGAYQSESPL